MMRFVQVFAPLAITAVFPVMLPSQQVQESAETTRVLSLREAMTLAERTDPRHQLVLDEQRLATATEREARGAYLPDASASLHFSGNSSRRLTAFDNFGNAIKLDAPITFRSSQSVQGLGLVYTIFDGGARELQLAASRMETAAVQADVRASAGELKAEVVRRYYQAVGAAARLALAKRMLASALGRLDATERLFRVAGASHVDVLGVRLELASREAQLVGAHADLRKSQLLLAEIVGLSPSVPLQLSDTLPSTAPNLQLDHARVVAATMVRNPLLQALDARVRAADRRVSAARGGRWPRVVASASFNRSFSDRGYAGLFEINPPDQYVSFGLSASLPLFDRFQTATRVARAAVAVSDARYELASRRVAVTRAVLTAIIDVEDAEQRLAIAQRTIALSRELADLAQQQYRMGALRFAELQPVLENAASAERAEIEARVALASALATLDEMTGASAADLPEQ